MLRKPLNKIRYRFLKGPFTENPLPFKKLNRKGVELRNLSNKRGLAEKIRKIQKNIIKQEKEFAVTKIKNTLRKQSTVDKQTHNFIKANTSFLRLTKNKTNTVEKKKVGKSKYMFSLEQVRAEFYRKQTQHNKKSTFKILLEERKKCSIAYGCLNKKQMQRVFLQAKKFSGKFDENFVKIVESRLDVALFRICFFPTLFSARQWVNHGHILVNNSVINLPGYQLKGGDIISVAPDKRDVLKHSLSVFIAEKIKIRGCHYLVKIKIFYDFIKSCIPWEKIRPSLGRPFRIFKGKYPTLWLGALRIKNADTGFSKERTRRFESAMSTLKKVDQDQEETKIRNLCFKKSFKNRVDKNTNKEGANSIRTLGAHKIQRLPLFSILDKVFLFFSKKEEQLLPFLKIRNLFTTARPLTQRVAALKISGMKPLNLEVCYKNMVAIFLYSPQKVALPVSIDLHLIAKSIQ